MRPKQPHHFWVLSVCTQPSAPIDTTGSAIVQAVSQLQLAQGCATNKPTS